MPGEAIDRISPSETADYTDEMRELLLFMVLAAAFPAAAQQPRRAEAGELKAMHELGFRLMDNSAVPYHDDAASYFWLTQAADRGYWLSSYYLARAILYGWRWPGHENTDAENEEGLRWLRRAAQDVDPGEGGDLFSMLGDLHAGPTRGALTMIPVGLDYEEAAKWYRLCAIEGEPWCQAALGKILVYRLGRPETKREGCEWLAQGAENGHPTAMFDLGGALRSGLCGRGDLKQAYVWLPMSGCAWPRSGTGAASARIPILTSTPPRSCRSWRPGWTRR